MNSMTKKIQVSHSANMKLQECGFKYQNHYIKRLRSKWVGSALLFGSALDDALNMMLINHGKEDALELALDMFDKRWSNQNIHYVPTKLQTCTWIDYKKYDLDLDLIDDDELQDLVELSAELKSNREPLEWFEAINKKFGMYTRTIDYGGKGLTRHEALKKLMPTERKFFQAVNWGCCRHRAYLMINAYYRDIYPLIEKVIHVQKEVKVKNEEGHILLCYIDVIVKFKGEKYLYVLDNKSSRYEYKEESVRISPQLGLYCYVEQLEYAAYAVMNKKINKNTVRTCRECGVICESRHATCPEDVKGKRCKGMFNISIDFEATTQLIKDRIPYEVQEMIVCTADQAIMDIQNKRFNHNLVSCEGKYGKCDYFDHEKCWGDKTSKELDMFIVPERKKK